MTEISSHGNICATCYDGEILLHSRYINTEYVISIIIILRASISYTDSQPLVF